MSALTSSDKPKVPKKKTKPPIASLATTEQGLPVVRVNADQTQMTVCTGVESEVAAEYLLSNVLNGGSLKTAEAASASLALMTEIAPQDALEGMLVSQTIVSNDLAAHFAKRAMTQKELKFVERYSNLALRFGNLFIRQMEALDKHRGKGKQQVTVIHQHVNQGGQGAIVASPPGGRDE